MDDFINIFGQRVIRDNKYAQTVRAVEKSMSQYGVTRPLTVEYKNVFNDLPKTPKEREGEQLETTIFFLNNRICILDEILRQLRCSKFPKTEHEIANKLHDLYVYSDMGKSLESDAITLAVMKSLTVIENQIPPPGKRNFKGMVEKLIRSEKSKSMYVRI